MKKTIDVYQFRDTFKDYDRDDFSYEGYEALFDWFEEYDNCSDTETELDVIAICCDFTEYENLEELKREHDVESIEELEENTIVIPISGTDRFIIQNY